MAFKKDDRVILPRLGNNWNPSKLEPLWDSKYGCVGTVIDTSLSFARMAEGILLIHVHWDNGHRNHYYEDRLLRHDDTSINPNIAFSIKKRGERWGSK